MENKENKTAIVMGIARTGTSVLAGLLYYLDVFMGPDMFKERNVGNPVGTFEDVSFLYITAMINRYKEKEVNRGEYLRNLMAIGPLIKEREDKYNLWGFKSALTYKMIEIFLKEIKNPYLIFIFRSPLDTVLSRLAHFSYYKGNKKKVMEIVLSENEELMNKYFLLKQQGYPVIKTCHDKLLLSPVKEAQKIATALNISFEEKHQKRILNFVRSDYCSFE